MSYEQLTRNSLSRDPADMFAEQCMHPGYELQTLFRKTFSHVRGTRDENICGCSPVKADHTVVEIECEVF